MTTTVHILLGSNLGDRPQFIAQARKRLSEIEGGELIATSAIYLSEAQEMPGENPSFLNQVIKMDYAYSPRELLRTAETIETELGRTSKGKNLPRTIDIDILLFGDQQINDDDLIVPHPRLTERFFALVPLLQIDPEITHPTTGQPLADYLTPQAADTVRVYKDHVARNF